MQVNPRPNVARKLLCSWSNHQRELLYFAHAHDAAWEGWAGVQPPGALIMKHSSEKGHSAQPAPPKISLQSPFLCVHGLNTCVRAEGWGRAAQRRGLCASETRPVLSETSFRLGLLALDAPFPDCLLPRTEPPSYCPFAETLCASESVSSGLGGALNCARSHARVISYMVRKYSGDRLHLPVDACRTSRLRG